MQRQPLAVRSAKNFNGSAQVRRLRLFTARFVRGFPGRCRGGPSGVQESRLTNTDAKYRCGYPSYAHVLEQPTLNQRVQGSSHCAPTNHFNDLCDEREINFLVTQLVTFRPA